MGQPDDSLGLTEEEFRKVIERAELISSGRDRISLAELRTIAADLDIEGSALERALAEVLKETAVASRDETMLAESRPILRRRLALGAVAGALLGVGSSLMGLAERMVIAGIEMVLSSTAWVDVPVAIVLGLLSLFALLRSRSNGSLRSYCGEVTTLWLTFFFGWSLIRMGSPGDLLAFLVTGLSVSLAIGFLVLRDRRDGTKSLPKAEAEEISLPRDPSDESKDRYFERREFSLNELMTMKLTLIGATV